MASDRDGVAAGSLQLYPGLRLEMGVDSNPLYQSSEEDPRPSGVVLVNPYVGVRTPEPRAAELTLDLGAAWEQFLASETNTGLTTGPNQQSGIDLEAGFGLRLNPNGVVSLAPTDSLTWATAPNLNPQGDPYRNLHNEFGVELALHPGGHGREERLGISGALGFRHRLWRYDQLSEYDHNGIGGRLELQWNFLPMTAIFANASVDKITYEEPEIVATVVTGAEVVDNVDSLSTRASLGFTGLLTRRLSLLASGGYGVGNYDSGRDPKTFLAHVDLGLHATTRSQIHLGWEHNFEDTLLSSFITFHRIYFNSTTQVGALGFGLSAYVHVNEYSTPTDDGDDVDIYNGDRSDTVVGGLADVSYAVTNWLSLGLRYSPAFRDSTATFADESGQGISADYVQHRAFFYLDLAVARPLPLAGVSGSPGAWLSR